MTMTVVLLFGALFAVLMMMSYYFGWTGWITVILALILVGVQWLVGPLVIKWTTNMRPLKANEYPWLQDTVKEICNNTRTPIPKIFIVRSGGPNAFVFGRRPSTSTLALTTGLLNRLTKNEVRAVIAHEVGHINHKDMVVMTLVSVIPVLAYFVGRTLLFAPKRDERSKAGAAIIAGIIALVIYYFSNLLVLALSRTREFYSDRFAGNNVRPRLLASALAKITYGLSLDKTKTNTAARSFFIADPVSSVKEVSALSSHYKDLQLTDDELKDAMRWEKKNPLMRFGEIFRTHPLTYKRIAALMELEKEQAM